MFGIPATVLLLIQALSGDDGLLPYSSAFEAVLYFYAAGALIRQLVEDGEVTRDELFGIGATASRWSREVRVRLHRRPGGRAGKLRDQCRRLGIEPGWSSCSCRFSTTLSSTGLSDVIPAEPFARSVVMIEQLSGLAFIAMVVSYLVALTVLSNRRV